MFELLLIIYLLPVLIIGILLLKLIFWLLRIAIRLAVWLVKKTFILIWKLIVLIFIRTVPFLILVRFFLFVRLIPGHNFTAYNYSKDK